MTVHASSPASEPPAGPTASYVAGRAVPDEMIDGAGDIRPHWRTFAARFDALGRAALARRWEEARRLIHDNGVSFNVYGDPSGMERPWPLGPMPVLVAPGEYARLAAGLAQRAALLDRLLADLYGPQRVLTERLLPAEIVLASPTFLRACRGVTPPAGRFLHLYAADIVRGASGAWQVLADRTQAPAGAGYALENRIVVSRTLPDEFRECRVQRLAPFFRQLRATLAGLAPRRNDNPRIVLLSPGPYNATYFEQAFLAQYLGYTLVQGTDLTVRDGRVFLKTLGGLHPVDVILRRLNDDFCDPLELRGDSTLGIPGLMQAVRDGTVAVANALGTGVLQTPAIIPYLPALCRALLGEELALPSVETWWCGDPGALAQALDVGLEQLVIKRTWMGAGGRSEPIFGEALDADARAALRVQILAGPGGFVAQRRATLSTTPLFDGAALEPRQLLLRTFAVSMENRYHVMPGALGVVAGRTDRAEISIQQGAASQDTWIVAAGPVSTLTLLRPPSAPVDISRGGGDLPSRVADNLFWLGRYAERADAVARLARTTSTRIADAAGRPDTFAVGPELGPHVEGDVATDVAPLAGALETGTLAEAVRALHRVAHAIRDRLSADTWRVVTALEQEARDLDGDDGDAQTGAARLPLLDGVIGTLAALSGLVMDSMTRDEGWRFLDMGRRLERALGLVRTIAATLTTALPAEPMLLEALLETADSAITYRRRYLATIQAAPVIDLLLADPRNPRSVMFQLAALSEHVDALPAGPNARAADAAALAATALDRVRVADVRALAVVDERGQRPALAALLGALARALPALSDMLSESYFSHAAVARQLAEGERSVIYRVTHVTEYVYEERVSTSQHQLHLLPRAAPGQSCTNEDLSVTPPPALRRDRTDDFGNRCTYLEIHAPHQELRVVARSQIAIDAPARPLTTPAGPPWEEARDAVAAAGDDPTLFAARAFTFASPHVPVSPAARAYAAASFSSGRPLLEAALELTRRIYDEFTYDADATTVSTSIEEVLQHRRGVCQDFAHLQVACLRALGLPARYMSGYLITERKPGEPRIVGADASHAWLSLFCPGAGWVPLDPTNANIPAGRHITVAWGRDFSDVTPMRGVVVGGGAHDLTVSVDVAPVGS